MNENFTKEYFIEKFSKIPEEEIGHTNLKNKCALWHCGVRYADEQHTSNSDYIPTEEAMALVKLFGGRVTKHPVIGDIIEWGAVYGINDTGYELGKTPKERILNKLKSL